MTAADRPSVTPRVGDQITTAEQLDALPKGAVLARVHSDGSGPTVYVNERRMGWLMATEQITPPSVSDLDAVGNRLGHLTVLYVPGEPSRPSVTDDARADLHPVVTEHRIIGTQTGKQGAGQVVPEDSVLCIKCGWMRCSDYTWHLSDALAAAGRAETATDDHDFLPVNGHPDDDECTHRADGTDATYCGEPRTAHDHSAETTTEATERIARQIAASTAMTGTDAREYVEAVQALQHAETTTATVEDALDSLPYFTFEDDDVAPDEEFVRKSDVARLLTTARTRPTREQIIDALVMSPLSDTAGTDLRPFEQTADAVLALLEGGGDQ